MRRHRNVKIVATLGPASSSKEMIRALFDAGADVFRLNMSHGSHDDHRARHDTIREIEAETGRPIAILADLQGPSCAWVPLPPGRTNWPWAIISALTCRLIWAMRPASRCRTPRSSRP